MTSDRGWDGLLTLFATFSLMIISALLIEKTASFKFNSICAKLWEQKKDTWGDNLKLLLVRGAFQYIGLGIFTFVAGAIATYFFNEEDPFRVISLFALILVVKIRAISIILRLILAPYAKGLRLLTM
jgi:hypothetical protein